MHSDIAGQEYLYTTVIPVLLDGDATAGKIARDMYLRHEITAHWFGYKRGISLWGCSKCHRLPCAVTDMSDTLLLQILLDFAKEQSGLLVLYPCSPAAEAFILRRAKALESCFVIQRIPEAGDPLFPLVLKND